MNIVHAKSSFFVVFFPCVNVVLREYEVIYGVEQTQDHTEYLMLVYFRLNVEYETEI